MLAHLYFSISGTTANGHAVDVDPDSTAIHQRLGQAETRVEESTRVEVEDKEITAEDVEAEKIRTLQLKMRRLSERLYPEKGTLVLDPYS
jgi:hypothetical protein